MQMQPIMLMQMPGRSEYIKKDADVGRKRTLFILKFVLKIKLFIITILKLMG